MNIARSSIQNPVNSWLIILILLFGGIWGFLTIGRLEDPSFTIKTAVIITQYPGATAEEVANEISEPLESEIQKMAEMDSIQSNNQPGVSLVTVNIKDTFDGTQLPGIWQKLRDRVNNVPMPDGAYPPFVNDSFGDVYGIYYALTAPGYSTQELYDFSHFIRRELLAVPGVADVSVDGLPEEVIYVEPDLALASNLHIPPTAIQGAIANASSLGYAGSLQDENGRTLIFSPDADNSVEDIAGLSIGVGGNIVNLRDFANVYRGIQDHPNLIIRHNGERAFTVGIAGVQTDNIVTIGKRVDAKLLELGHSIPLGMQSQPIYQQHLVVDESSTGFIVNLAMSVGIVIGVLALAMGWRAAIVVGVTLLLTVSGTIMFMKIFAIEMERISLGALIIAMGMLVDNAIVLAEGMQVNMKRGQSSLEAAENASKKTQIPLLGATVIGIMAFAGIGLSPDSTGEFLFSLFAVIAISLLLSWFLALTVTPFLGDMLFQVGDAFDGDGYEGSFFTAYKRLLYLSIKSWWAVIVGLLVLTVLSIYLFGFVRQQFFPHSDTPLFFVDYKLAQGASIHETSRDLEVLEDWLLDHEDVVSASTFVGTGAARFMLTYDAGDPNPSYGHMIVRTPDVNVINDVMLELEEFGATALPQAEMRVFRLAFGPGGGGAIEVRYSGSDPEILRNLADETIQTMREATPHVMALRTDWREMEQVLRPVYSTERAQEAGISRNDVTQALLFATEGLQSGIVREDERRLPIIVRPSQDSDLALTDYQIYSETAGAAVPFEQIIDGMEFEGQNTLMMRRDRVLTITVQADIPTSMTATEVRNQLVDQVEAIHVPEGYKMEWGGEFENSSDANASLGATLPITFIIMVLITVLLFNAVRQPIIIWLIVPMAVIGVSLSLLLTGFPFSFTALLGMLSLSGMLIKNSIVLIDEIDNQRALPDYSGLVDAITQASVSRVRPVLLAAATTILGMIPLLPDAFFQSMAVTIMGGLAFASVLILIAAPVLYYAFFKKVDVKA